MMMMIVIGIMIVSVYVLVLSVCSSSDSVSDVLSVMVNYSMLYMMNVL